MYLSEISTARMTFYHDYIVVSKEALKSGSATHKKKEIMLKNQRKTYNGYMSPSTVRKVRTILTAWLTAFEKYNALSDLALIKRQRKLTFATLTLSQDQFTTDKQVKRDMLNRLIVELKRLHGVKYYFWRAEKQKNGRIHFHLMIDSYVSNRDLQSLWNNIQQDNGYMEKFFQEFHRYNAPSTDIRQISDTVNSINYIMKYVSKNPDCMENENMKVEGRIWGCSDELKKLKPYDTGEQQGLGKLLYAKSKKGEVTLFDSDHFAIFRVDVNRFLKTYAPMHYTQLNRYYNDMYETLYNSKHQQVARVPEMALLRSSKKEQCTQLDLPFDLNPFDRSMVSHHFDD